MMFPKGIQILACIVDLICEQMRSIFPGKSHKTKLSIECTENIAVGDTIPIVIFTFPHSHI